MKKISLVTAVAITTSMLPGFSADAATLTVGTREGFENNYVSDNSKVSTETVENYGGVLKFEKGDGDLVFNFSENATNGSYVLSMDVNMASEAKSSLLMFTKTSTKGNAPFLALKDSGMVTTYLDTWIFSQIGQGTYTQGEWQRYDFLIDLDQTLPSELYLDGVYAGDFILTNRGDSTDIDQMGKIHFTLSDAQDGAYVLLDNISFAPYTGTANMKAELTEEGKITVDFSETMPALSASDFTFTRTPKDGTGAENVALTLDYAAASKAVLTPADLSDGYTYTFSMPNKKTALNSTISERTFTFKKLGFDNSDAVQIDKMWDFEDGVAPNSATEVISEGDRGNVLRYNSDSDISFNLGQSLSSGKYVYSFDVKSDAAGHKYFRALGTGGNWVYFTKIDNLNRFGEAMNDAGFRTLGGKEITLGQWSRMDSIMDMTSKTADVYFDGEYAGQLNLSEKGRSGSVYTLEEFGGLFASNNSGANGLYLDNIRVRTLEEYYGAKLSADGNKLYIDFEENTNCSAENFKVLKTSGLLASPAEEVSFDITYQNPTRVVLTLDENIAAGNRYTVKMNNISSIFGTKLEGDTLSLLVSQDEVDETIVNDDMSGYTTDTILTAEGTPWAGNTNAVVTAENGAVTFTGNNSRLWYEFDSATKGIITVEMNVNINTDSTGEAIHFNAGNADKKLFFMTQIVNKRIICPTSSSINSNVYQWNEKSGDVCGQDVNIKLEFDTVTKNMKVYKNGTAFASGYPYGRDSVFGEGYDNISCIAIDIAAENTTVKISDIKVSQKYTPALVGDVSFVDVMGNKNDSTNVSSTTNKIEISYPQGLYEDIFNGVIEFTCDGVPVGYTGEYNKETKTYTMILDQLLGAGKTYQMKLSGTKNGDGTVYDAVEGTFTTGAAVFNLSNLDITKTSSGVSVAVDCVNTKGDESYYLIYAGYTGGALVHMDYVPLNLTKDSTEVEKVIPFEDASAATYDNISAFIWKSFENIVPVTKSVVK